LISLPHSTYLNDIPTRDMLDNHLLVKSVFLNFNTSIGVKTTVDSRFVR